MLRQGVWLCREHLEAVLRGSEMREFSRVCLRLDNIARHGRKPSSYSIPMPAPAEASSVQRGDTQLTAVSAVQSMQCFHSIEPTPLLSSPRLLLSHLSPRPLNLVSHLSCVMEPE